MLHRCLQEPELVWYIRKLEVWDPRNCWKIDGNTSSDEPCIDQSQLEDGIYTDEQMEEFLAAVPILWRRGGVRGSEDHLRAGHDGLLKILLMALSPRLEHLVFIRFNDGERGGSPYVWFKSRRLL